jgi:uncharacterized protein with von Willebrand factor type A (vWA) domain
MNVKTPTAPAILEPEEAQATFSLDVPAVAVALSRRLHAAGLPVTPERGVRFAQAVTLVGPLSRRQLYCTARTVFVSDHAHMPVFDRVFDSIFTPDPGAADRPAPAQTMQPNGRESRYRPRSSTISLPDEVPNHRRTAGDGARSLETNGHRQKER